MKNPFRILWTLVLRLFGLRRGTSKLQNVQDDFTANQVPPVQSPFDGFPSHDDAGWTEIES